MASRFRSQIENKMVKNDMEIKPVIAMKDIFEKLSSILIKHYMDHDDLSSAVEIEDILMNFNKGNEVEAWAVMVKKLEAYYEKSFILT